MTYASFLKRNEKEKKKRFKKICILISTVKLQLNQTTYKRMDLLKTFKGIIF
jgi:ribosomal protein S18